MGKGRKAAILFGILFLIGGIILPLGGQSALFSIPGYAITQLPSFVTNYLPFLTSTAYPITYIAIGLGAIFLIIGVAKRGGGVKMPKEAAMPTEEPKPEMPSMPEMETPTEEP